MTWSFREMLVLAVIREAGHDPVEDHEAGWAVCLNCHTSWYVSRRAEMADAGTEFQRLEVGKGITWANSLDFRRCGKR